MSGIEPSELVFTAQEFRGALKKALLAFESEFRGRESEVRVVIDNYDL
jgi:hypothetical protein